VGLLEEPGYAERIVMETLRLEQSEYIYRIVKTKTALDQYQIPAGWRFEYACGHLAPTGIPSSRSMQPTQLCKF
jgi:hypothetical protein